MSTRKEREIVRRLASLTTDLPAPEPPPELLQRLRNDLPAALAAAREGGSGHNGDGGDDADRDDQAGSGDEKGSRGAGSPPSAPVQLGSRRAGRRWLAAAAILVMTVGGGWLSWKLWLAGPPPGSVDLAAPGVREEALQSRQAAASEGAAAPQENVARGEAEALRDASPPSAATTSDELERRRAPRDLETRKVVGPEPAPPGAPRPAAVPEPRQESARAVASAAAPQAAPAASAGAVPATRLGNLRVKVLGPDVYPLPGVTVQAFGARDHRKGVTDDHGQVTLRDLPVGTYRVRAELDGFSAVEVPGVDIPAAGAPLVRIPLSLAYLAEEIVVSGVPAPPPPSVPPPEMEPVLSAPLPDAGLSDEAYGVPAESGYAAAEPEGPIHVPSVPKPKAVQAPPPSPPGRRVDRGRARVDATEMEQQGRLREAEESESTAAAQADVEADLDDELAAEEAPDAPVFTDTAADRLSTFGLDVDTGSYTIIRQELADEWLPDPWDVRVEEVVNYLRYPDLFAAEPARPGEVFRMQGDGAPWPFAAATASGSTPATYLLRFRVAARPVAAENRKPAVLTLLVDVSGSMEGENLEMVRQGVNRLLDTLEPRDRVALVVFSDDAEMLASHGDRNALRTAVADLATRGGTNAEAGLVLAYQQAEAAFDPAAANRVILLSDGVANMGATTVNELLDRVAAAAGSGIELTTVCVGSDSDDELMEQLADRGDGRYLHVDRTAEAERVFVEELTGTLQTVAEEARVQVELDPRLVRRWRLLGYENRALEDYEFRYDDTVDAGEVGAGQSVTALYEVELTPAAALSPDQPLALLRLRYRRPGEDLFREDELWLRGRELAASWDAAAADLRLAAVAGRFAELLRPAPELSSYLRTAAGLDALVPQARAVADALPGSPQAAELAGLVATAAKVAAEDAAEEAEYAAEEAAQRAEEEKNWRWMEDDEDSPPTAPSSAPSAAAAESPPSAPPDPP